MSVIHFWNRSICGTRLFLKVHYFSKRILLKGEFNFKLLRIITFFCFPKLQLLTLLRVIDLSKSEYIFPFKHPTAEATWLVNLRYSALKGSRPFFLETIDFFQVRMYVDSYEGDEKNQSKSAQEMLDPCIDVALQVTIIKIFLLLMC